MPVAKFQQVTSVIKDALFLSSIIVTLCTVVGSFAITMAWPIFIEKLREDLNIATSDDLLRLQTQINQITGENRIIRMPTGHSFVAEPVAQGSDISLTLVMARTEHGQGCNFVSGTPLYTDARGIPYAGAPIPPIKQIANDPERLQMDLEPPARLQPGRIGMTIGLQYSCPFGSNGEYINVFDETDVIFFQMDASSD